MASPSFAIAQAGAPFENRGPVDDAAEVGQILFRKREPAHDAAEVAQILAGEQLTGWIELPARMKLGRGQSPKFASRRCQSRDLHLVSGRLARVGATRYISSMRVIVDLCVVPVGAGTSLSPYIAACQKILSDAGLKTALHAYGTNIEGPWDEVFAAVRRCHEVVHEMGAPRITTTIKLGTRVDRAQSMEEKVQSVVDKMS